MSREVIGDDPCRDPETAQNWVGVEKLLQKMSRMMMLTQYFKLSWRYVFKRTPHGTCHRHTHKCSARRQTPSTEQNTQAHNLLWHIWAGFQDFLSRQWVLCHRSIYQSSCQPWDHHRLGRSSKNIPPNIKWLCVHGIVHTLILIIKSYQSWSLPNYFSGISTEQ